MKAIYKFHFHAGRQGILYGMFIEEVDKVQQLIDSKYEIEFGEALGKHSDISGPLEEGDITLITTEIEAIAFFEKYNLAHGFNPFKYISTENS